MLCYDVIHVRSHFTECQLINATNGPINPADKHVVNVILRSFQHIKALYIIYTTTSHPQWMANQLLVRIGISYTSCGMLTRGRHRVFSLEEASIASFVKGIPAGIERLIRQGLISLFQTLFDLHIIQTSLDHPLRLLQKPG